MSFFKQYRPSRNSMFPPGVMNLVIINGIMFIAKEFALRGMLLDMTGLLGVFHPYCPDFRWYQYITNIFMHGDFMHILFNMFGLVMFGYLLENAYGTKRFLIFYLVCGIGASIIYQAWASFEQYQLLLHHGYSGSFAEGIMQYPPCGPLIGASGAVYGLLMGSALLFPNTELPYMGFFGMPIKLKWLAVIYGGVAVANGFRMNPEDHVAHFAHIGGMIFGFILVKIFAKSRTHFY
ncbi:MAG TPA: rhomboid family intramembrane serine protease [Bacteroidia bacterium]|nr:rhomboid family intramembrane serine protease [Bacteroidia bacterium]